MKKCLFLLFLLVIYFILTLSPKTKDVLSYEDLKNDGVVMIEIKYENGVNSKELKTLFDDYDGEYYVSKLDINGEEIMVSCSNFKKCIDDIYAFNNLEFETNYIVAGFRITSIYFIAYRDEIEKYLSYNNVVYKTW